MCNYPSIFLQQPPTTTRDSNTLQPYVTATGIKISALTLVKKLTYSIKTMFNKLLMRYRYIIFYSFSHFAWVFFNSDDKS